MVRERPELRVVDDARALAHAAAEHVALRVGDHAGINGERFTFAVSGGRTPWLMFDRLRELRPPWERLALFQVDERVAPPGPDRNLTQLEASLPPDAVVNAMPVELADLVVAAEGYASTLPTVFDLVHLGLGADGHTASLVPGDPVLEVDDRAVAVTEPYQGHRRMTLTYPPLDRAAEVLWLVSGADKAEALRALLDGDVSIPAGRVRAERQLVIADRAAAGQ